MSTFHCVLCTDEKGHIGSNGKLLFKCPIDMQRFNGLTTPLKHTKHAVIMGRKTWMSIPKMFRPLKRRINVVLTQDAQHAKTIRQEGGFPFTHVSDALAFVDTLQIDKVFVIGGATLYNHNELQNRIKYIHHTKVHIDASQAFDANTLVAVDSKMFQSYHVVEEWSAHIPCHFLNEDDTNKKMHVSFRTLQCLSNKESSQTGEQQYINLLKETLDAPPRSTRNSTTLSTFGKRMVIDLSDGTVPLLTSKKMAWKTVIRELLWFVRGNTDNELLQKEKVFIWNANASRAFLDSRGLTERAEHDLGPVYGFQWRHCGASYVDCHTDYSGQGIDQLEECRQQIMHDSQSRRMIFSAWNPADLSKMALPPCHLLGQWYVKNDDTLWLQVYQRSGDLFLGVPFNLFSYSVLVHMMAYLTKKKVGGLVHIIGDAHIYDNHKDVVREQLQRNVHRPPTFRVKEGCAATIWEDFTLDSFDLVDYTCEDALKANMIA
jgi:dihydrofolate reductase/thymidylate synthase